jgi:hypothetical protein
MTGSSASTPVIACETITCVSEDLAAKLHPHRFSAMSGKMAAVVAYILDVRFTEPAISELVVTSDGFVLVATEGDIGANDLLGTEADLNRNLLSLVEAAGLTDEEIREFGELQRARIKRYTRA